MPRTAAPRVGEVPIGAIIAYVGPATNLLGLEEQGWLLCDGRAVPNDEAHSALWNTIGTAFGEGGYPTFYLPDLRGMFLRGVADAASGRDPDVTDRTAQNAGGHTGQTADTVGSRQSHEVENHQHRWDGNFGTISHEGWDLNVQLAQNSPHNSPNQGTQPTTNVDGGGVETRPSNVSVYYLIRAR